MGDGARLGQGSFDRDIALVVLVIAAALAFVLLNVVKDLGSERVDTRAGSAFPCTVTGVYDGDGPINCAEIDLEGRSVQVRLRGIEAREADNSCRYADLCLKASGAEAKAELTRLANGRLQCQSFGPSYGRVDAICHTEAGVDLSCEMLKSGTAVRWAEYDPDGRLIPCSPEQR